MKPDRNPSGISLQTFSLENWWWDCESYRILEIQTVKVSNFFLDLRVWMPVLVGLGLLKRPERLYFPKNGRWRWNGFVGISDLSRVGMRTRVSSRRQEPRKQESGLKKRQKKRRKKRRFGFDCKYEMIQKVKRKEEDKRERDETRGREKKKKTFALCCFLFFLFSFCHFIMGFK